MKYVCVDVQSGRAANGRPYYLSFFMPADEIHSPISPYKLFGYYPVGSVIVADVVIYKLPCIMKNRRGIRHRELQLFCRKTFDRETKKWFWIDNPEVEAQRYINHCLTPVEEE